MCSNVTLTIIFVYLAEAASFFMVLIVQFEAFLYLHPYLWLKGFRGGSDGKASACNAGDPSPIPGLGRSTGEGTGYPLQYSRASLVAQTVKNPPATWQIWVQSLDWEDPLEKGMVTHSNTLA